MLGTGLDFFNKQFKISFFFYIFLNKPLNSKIGTGFYAFFICRILTNFKLILREI